VGDHKASRVAGTRWKSCTATLAFAPLVAWSTSTTAQSVPNKAALISTSWTLSAAQPGPNETDSRNTPDAPSSEQAPPAAQPGSTSAAAANSAAGSGNDLAMKMTNPVTDLWMIQFEFNNYKLEKDPLSPVSGKWVNSLYLQPVLPVSLTKDVSLITRPVMTIYQSVPYPKGPGQTGRKTDFGDLILAQVVSPKLPQPWIFAAGPTWIFPTAGSKLIGQGKWQLGPAVGGGVVTPKYMIAGLVQQWWSFAGKSDRKDTSQMAILPLVYAFWGEGWSVGYSGQMQVDWKARHGNRWTVPAGLALGKVVKFGILPVQIRAGAQYIPISPEFGPKWNFTLQITPLIPRLIKNPIFE
jgi:hypothetical protein